MAEEKVEELSAEIGGQKLSLKSVALNTIISAASLIAVLAAIPYGYSHIQDTKEASKELVGALKEMTQAAREQNCLISMPIDRRDPELCRRIAR